LQMDKEGTIVYQTEDIKIYRATSHRFCLETRKSFEEALVRAGMGSGYINWCISSGAYHYKSYRDPSSGQDSTIYFIENTKRADYEGGMWEQYADQLGSSPSSRSYMQWRKDNAIPRISDEEFERKSGSKFWDNYNVAVLFVKNVRGTDYYWLVSASNDADWGKRDQFDFETVAQRIWPSTQDQSKRDEGSEYTSNMVNVTQDIIDADFYHIPSQAELDRMKRVVKTVPWTELEQAEQSGSSSSTYNRNVDPRTLEEYSYDKKEKWLDATWLSTDMKNKLFSDRNDKSSIIPKELWKILPSSLKIKYISTTIGAPLTKEMYDDIKDTPRAVKAYADMLKRRLLDPNPNQNLLEQLRRATNIKKIEALKLNDNELNLISGYLDLKEINQMLATKKEELKDIISKPFSVKNVKRKEAKRNEIDALERLLDQPDLALLYSSTMRDALDRIKRDNLIEFNREPQGLNKMKRLLRSSRISPIYKEANFRDWLSFKGEKLFGDILSTNTGIDRLNTVWEVAPKFDDLEVDLVAKRKAASKPGTDPKVKTAMDETVKKFISTLLTGGDPVPDLYLTQSVAGTQRYIDQLKNVASYIINMNPNHQKEIMEMFKRMYIYYDVKTIYNILKIENKKYANQIADIVNNINIKFPFLDEVTPKITSSDEESVAGSGIIGTQSTRHTEELG